MKITELQLKNILDKTSDKKLLRDTLHYIFSFEENILLFGYFNFAEYTTSKFAGFHQDIINIMLQESSDAVAAPRGHAKQLADSTPILTTKGWTTHGKLKIGDYVFHPSGFPVRVIAINNKTSSDYIVTTRDGEIIRCSGEHEWVVWDRNLKREVILETKDMLCGGEQRSRYQLPLREPLNFNHKELEIDPYFLGLWLGDGSSSKPCITHDKNDVDSIKAIPYNISTQCIHSQTGVYTTYFSHQGIIQKIRRLGIYKNKRIPNKYFQASLSQRLELMAGLIDSDGYISKKRGRVRFVNTNYNLIKDVERLAITLGSRPYIVSSESGYKIYPNNKICQYKKSYQLCFDPIIKIPTKLIRKRSNRIPVRQRLGIISVEFKPNGEVGNCIQVDSYDGLYLAGKRLIPTHNSTLVGLIFLIWCIVYKKEKYIVYISANHHKTVQFLDPIRTEMKHNKLLKWLYGSRIKSVSDEDGKDREDCYDILGCRVEAVSFEKNLRGFKYGASRPTLIIGDDIETDERVINPDIRLKDQHKLNKIVIPSLDPINGRFKMIGTILHWDSLLIKKIRTYKGRIYKACEEDFSNILWGDRFTVDILKKFRADIGHVAFASEFFNNPIESGSSVIKGEWIKRNYDENISYDDEYKDYARYKGCDFAFGDRVTNDDTAFVDVNIKYNLDKYYLSNLNYYKGLSITEQFEIIQTEHNKHNYTDVCMEENSIKGMSKDLMNYKFPYYLIWTGATDPAPKFKDKEHEFENKRHTVGKKAMILRLATLIENDKIIFPYKTEKDKELTNKLHMELVTFALNDGKLVEVGIHADGPIAIAMVLERINNKKQIGYAI